jgi:hypothetical protein
VNPPILVRHVAHLTDARYFAAAGVDWISLDVADDAESFARFQAIRDWVEGVNVAAEPLTADEDLLARILIELRPAGMIVPSAAVHAIPPDVQSFVAVDADVDGNVPSGARRIIVMPAAMPDSANAWGQEDLVEADWTPGLVRQLMDAGYTGGYCLHGGREELTGVKDFTPIDEVMELLRP